MLLPSEHLTHLAHATPDTAKRQVWWLHWWRVLGTRQETDAARTVSSMIAWQKGTRSAGVRLVM
jgi:hypothetical protein